MRVDMRLGWPHGGTHGAIPASDCGRLIEVERKTCPARGALRLDQLLTGVVEPHEQLLQECEISGVKPLDDGRSDGRAAEPRDDTAEQRDRRVSLVGPHARVAGDFDFIARRRETHDALAMQRARVVADLKPRQDARVTTPEGQRMKRFAGRVWVAAADHYIARVRLHATDSVSVGWGVVARVERGSGFDFLRKKVAGSWVASQLTIEGSGNTLLFRSFHIKTVTTYSNHEPYKPDEP